jgi:hypothetical protein
VPVVDARGLASQPVAKTRTFTRAPISLDGTE